MKKWFTIVLIINQSYFSFGQTDSLEKFKNRIYIEALGYGGYYSLNYEQKILSSLTKNKLSGRIGFSYWFNDIHAEHYLPLLIEINYQLLNSKKSEVFTGIGGTIWSNPPKLYDPNHGYYFYGVKVGYQYKIKDYRIGMNIYLITKTFKSISPWGGVIIGKVF